MANILGKLTEKPSKFIATMLLGNNIALVVYGLFMGDVLTQWLSGIFQQIMHFKLFYS